MATRAGKARSAAAGAGHQELHLNVRDPRHFQWTYDLFGDPNTLGVQKFLAAQPGIQKFWPGLGRPGPREGCHGRILAFLDLSRSRSDSFGLSGQKNMLTVGGAALTRRDLQLGRAGLA